MCTFAVARIGLVKPDKAKGVENMVLQMAQRGQITEKVCQDVVSHLVCTGVVVNLSKED